MGRYDIATGIEGESEPGSRGRVLRNLPGIKSKRAMDQAEAEALLGAQEQVLAEFSTTSPMTCDFIRHMHAAWLGHIYVWAGKYRTVEMAKGEFVWPPARLVAQNMERFQQTVLRPLSPCRATTIGDLARTLAIVQSEFLLIHPFREGNGRSARWICDLLAMQAGHRPLEYAFAAKGGGRNSQRYLSAVIAGYAANYVPLAGFLEEAIRRAGLRALGEESFTPRAPSK